MTELAPAEAMQRGIEAVRKEEYLLGLTLLGQAYSAGRDIPAPDGLSYYGLCVALVQKKFKPAVELCKKAIEMQFYHGEHYANLARVYVAGESRRKALTTIERGLQVVPDDDELLRLRNDLGLRRKPPIPFLSRSNPLNVAIGRARHARQVADVEREKEKHGKRQLKAKGKAPGKASSKGPKQAPGSGKSPRRG